VIGQAHSGLLPNGLPQGISLTAPAFADRQAATMAQRFHQAGQLPVHAHDVRPAANPDHVHRHKETAS